MTKHLDGLMLQTALTLLPNFYDCFQEGKVIRAFTPRRQTLNPFSYPDGALVPGSGYSWMMHHDRRS